MFPHVAEYIRPDQSSSGLTNKPNSPSHRPKLLQERVSNLNSTSFSLSLLLKNIRFQLSHYLDVVEVQIAKQVSSKSDAFFHTMTSHDALMENLGQTITKVRTLR